MNQLSGKTCNPSQFRLIDVFWRWSGRQGVEETFQNGMSLAMVESLGLVMSANSTHQYDTLTLQRYVINSYSRFSHFRFIPFFAPWTALFLVRSKTRLLCALNNVALYSCWWWYGSSSHLPSSRKRTTEQRRPFHHPHNSKCGRKKET